MATHRVSTEHFEVLPGQVMGLKQIAKGYENGDCFVSYTFVAALEVGEEADVIEISGQPPLRVVLRGTNGDLATVAIVANAMRRVVEAPAGLVCMPDLPMVTHW